MKLMRQSSKIDDSSITEIILIKSVKDHDKESLFKSLKFEAKYKQVAFLAESNQLYIGTDLQPASKNIDPYNVVDYYELGAQVVNSTKATNINEFRLVSCCEDVNDMVNFLLGIAQASWHFDKYLTDKQAKSRNISVHLSHELSAALTPKSETLLNAISEGVTLTREIVEDGPEAINPTTIKSIIKDEFSGYDNVLTSFVGLKEMNKRGMEGITFVGRASRHEPVMAHVVVQAKKEVTNKICLVGKGVTYDSGGYNIKTGGHMATMKMDMAGAGTMFGVIKALAVNGGLDHTEVHWISAFVENLIDGSAYKPDDVMTTSSGITVEILNTDAEGRLTLADALTYATLQNPDYIVDAATLTGACIMAVSEHYTALMANDSGLANSLLDTFEEEREKTVYTPLPEAMRDTIKGRISDLKNISNTRHAGHKTAGLFLSNFVDQNLYHNNEKLGIKEPKAFPWVHLDIAGSAYNTKNNSLGTEGATGQSVRSLVKWLMKVDDQGIEN